MIIWGPNIAQIFIQLKTIWMVTIDKIVQSTIPHIKFIKEQKSEK